MKRIVFAAATAASMLALSSGASWSADDQTFLKTAIGINLAEIQTGQLAEQKSRDSKVKNYGQMLVKAHEAANQEATALAQKEKVTVPDAPSEEDPATYQQLSKLTGSDFDRAFLDKMAAGHQAAIKLFSDKANDPQTDVTAYAKKNLPGLKKHLQTAEDLRQNVSSESAETDRQNGTGAATAERTTRSADTGSTQSASSDAELASKLIGSSVYTSDAADAQKIGDINDLVVAPDGRINSAIIGVGGFLGMGEKTVAVSFNQLKFRSDGNGNRQFVLQTTKEELQNAPAFDKTAMANRDEESTGNARQRRDAGDTAQNESATDQGAANQNDSTTSRQARRTDLKEANTADLTAEKLLNTTVYGADDENVGEVGDVLLTKEGKIDAVVLDVGGFLGIGEKPVAVAFQDLDIRTDANGTLYIYTKFTRQQLEAGPKYNKDTYEQDRSKMRLRSGS